MSIRCPYCGGSVSVEVDIYPAHYDGTVDYDTRIVCDSFRTCGATFDGVDGIMMNPPEKQG